MAQLPVDQVGDWVEHTGRRLSRRSTYRDGANAARAFTRAVRDLDRRSLKNLSRRVAHDDDLRDALSGLTRALQTAGSRTPDVTRKVADTATRNRRATRLGVLLATVGVAALVLRAAMRRRRRNDPAAVFDAHVSSNGASSSHEVSDSEVGERS